MHITEVRIKLMDVPYSNLVAFAMVMIDAELVIRDLKIYRDKMRYKVGMPSRKLTTACQHCGVKNFVESLYCHMCGKPFSPSKTFVGNNGKIIQAVDVLYPVNRDCRAKFEAAILEAYLMELDRSRQPGYSCGYDASYFDNGSNSRRDGA